MLIRNLAGIFNGQGFVERDGRRVRDEDVGFVEGPIDIAMDDATKTITSIGRALSGGGETIDATGHIALPGFVDPHTHAIFAGERSAEYFMRWAGRSYVEIAQAGGGIHSTVRATESASDEHLLSALTSVLRKMRLCGAALVEVKSGYARTSAGELRLLRLIDQVRRTAAGIPRIRISFLGLHALPREKNEDDYVDEMIAALDTIAAENIADHVDSFPEKGFFSLESALRFTVAAAQRGLAAKVHADELCDLGSSAAFVRAGALSIDHLQHINDEAVSLLATNKTVATMLPATSFFVGIPYANARRLIDAGARVALATDLNPGTAPACDLQLTHMLAASQMKMTAAEILCASTFNAAAALGLESTHGALTPGRTGSVLLYPLAAPLAPSRPTDTLAQIFISRTQPTRVI